MVASPTSAPSSPHASPARGGLVLGIGLGLCTSALLGCTPVSFTDNAGGAFDSAEHRPWAVGTAATVSVRAGLLVFGGADASWVAVSEAPEVFAVSSQRIASGGGNLEVDLVALAEGQADLVIFQDDDREVELGRTTLEAVVPDVLQLLPAALVQVQGEGSAPLVTGPARILSGVTSTFLARYTRDGAFVFGSGILEPLSSDGRVLAEAQVGGGRDYLKLTRNDDVDPGAGAEAEIALRVGGTPLRTLRVSEVKSEELLGVELVGAAEANATDGTVLAVACQAAAPEGRVFGVPCAWGFGETTPEGQGDLLRYTFAADAAVEVTARLVSDGQEDLVSPPLTVHGREPQVGTSSAVGCSGAGASSALVWALLALLGTRRRARGQGGSGSVLDGAGAVL